MNILLIEDCAGFARHIVQELTASGHNVTWIVGAERVEGDYLIGILPSPGLDGFDSDSWNGEKDRLVMVDYTTVAVALVDGGLIKPVSSGTDYARALSSFGVPCVSITGGGAGAGPMAEAGCFAALPKEYVLLALSQNVLEFDSISRDPIKIAQALHAFSRSQHELQVNAREAHKRFATGFSVLDDAPVA
jgi:hypothetical protein